MKKLLLVGLLLVGINLYTFANQYDFSIDSTNFSLYFKIADTENNEVAIVPQNTYSNSDNFTPYGTMPSGKITLPAQVSSGGVDYTVVSIADGAFSKCTALNDTLKIPNTIKYIGDRAFQFCSGFVGDLIIPNSVLELGSYAFWGCVGFNGKLEISQNLTIINTGVFGKKDGGGYMNFTGNLVLPPNITSLGERAFIYCNKLTGNLVIPAGVTHIYNYVFYQCTELSGDLIIPDKVEYVGKRAFYQCNGFKGKFKLSEALETMEVGAFEGCSGLTGDLIIPDKIKSLPDYAFKDCSGFDGSIIVGNSVTTLGGYAIKGCTGVDTLILGNSLRSNGSYAFYDLDENVDVIIFKNSAPMESLSGFDYGNFNDKGGKVYVPKGSKELYQTSHSFTNIQEMDAIAVASGVNTLYYQIIEGTKNVSVTGVNRNNATGSLIIPDEIPYNNEIYKVTEIAPSAFKEVAFSGTLTIGNNVKTIGAFAFQETGGLNGELIIPNSVEYIGRSAFHKCYGFRDGLVIGDGVKIISDYAFYDSAIDSVKIGESVQEIGDFAFYSSDYLTGDLIIPNSVKKIGIKAFYDASFKGDIVIGDSVEYIADEAFIQCGAVNSITFGKQIKYIGEHAFNYCYIQGSLILDNPELVIADEAFTYNKFTNVSINAKSIGNNILNTWTDEVATGNLTLGKDVKSIADNAFKIHKFKTITSKATTPPQLGNFVFNFSEYNGKNGVVNVEYENVADYEQADGWEDFNYYNGAAYFYNIASDDLLRGETFITKDSTTTDGSKSIVSFVATPKANYEFVAWSDGVTDSLRTNVEVSCDTSFVAYFKTKYQIQFNANSGSGTMPAIDMLEGDSCYLSANIFTRAGYEFLGWSTDRYATAAEVEYQDVDLLKPMSNLTLYAIWQINKYTVNFDANGGEGDMPNQDYTYNQSQYLTENVFAKWGCDFLGWSFTADGEKQLNDKNYSRFTSDTTLYAVWKLNTFEVASDGNTLVYFILNDNSEVAVVGVADGVGNGDLIIPDEVSYNGTDFTVVSIAESAFESCYGFDGNLTIGNNVEQIAKNAFAGCENFSGALVLGEKVEAIDTKAFDGCIGFSEIQALNTNPANIKNNSFETTYLNRANVKLMVPCSSLDDYATANDWKRFDFLKEVRQFDYQILSDNDIKGGVEIVSMSDCSAADFEITFKAVPTRGYKFIRWNDNVEDEERTITITKDTTIVANFEVAYEIEYNANGGNGEMRSEVVPVASRHLLAPIAFTKSDCTFRGWATVPDGEVEYTNEQEVLALGGFDDKVKLYAVWEGESYISDNEVLGFSVYPNPTTESFIVDLGKQYEEVTIRITDVSGREIQRYYQRNVQKVNMSIIQPQGIYFINVSSENKHVVLQLVKRL